MDEGLEGKTFEGMNKPIESVILSDDKEKITFTFQDGSIVNLGVEGDCCSHSWIEHIDIPSDIKGATIQEILDQIMSTSEEGEYEVIQVYNTHFRTEKGDIILEYRNSSNGYYGGYLVRIPN